MTKRVKEVERSVLATFKEEIPSIYFSHRSDQDYAAFRENAEYVYRHYLKFPPEMFAGRSLLDFGAGTGENTVYLANWGAKCTLVEMNDDAQKISKEVFRKHTSNFDDHRFRLSSVFDYTDDEQYDIVHSRGVFSHTDDREEAFGKLASLLKPGGYLIFGDPNRAGGFQNMLQRYIIYRFAKTPDQMVDVSERLFKEDIDRSEKFLPRTRRAIIFDRWVVQQQDDPFVSDVLRWFHENGLQFYSSHPGITMPIFGDSIYHRPRVEVQQFRDIGALTEAIWLMQNEGDSVDAQRYLAPLVDFAAHQRVVVDAVGNCSMESVIDSGTLERKIDAYVAAFERVDLVSPIASRMKIVMRELKTVLRAVETNNLETVAESVKAATQLFRGANGVRHVDYIGYKKR